MSEQIATLDRVHAEIAEDARTNTQPGNILDRAVVLSVELRRLGTKRKVSSDAIETDADRAMVHVSKDILECESLKAIQKCDGETRTYLAKRCLPSQLRAGLSLLPIDLIETVDRWLLEKAAEREGLVERFITEYDTARDAARGRLGSLFDDEDYPSITKVRDAFQMKTKYLAFNTPPKLQRISREIYAREMEKAQREVAVLTDEVKGVLRTAAADLVGHLVERLTPNPDGTQKVFRDSLIGNVREFLDTFQARNIADDAELSGLVDQMRGVIRGFGAKTIRDDAELRAQMAQQFGEIKSQFDGMLMDRPKRVIDFGDLN